MSFEPSNHAHLHTMRRALERIARQMDGVDEARFLTDLYVADAVALQLSVVGEAARRLTPAFKAACPTIPWRRIIALRNLIAHEYERLEPARIWVVSSEYAPDLARQL
ncbi:MAG: DUF86 domain-containing protein, partial [Alphaproteobacteria bacterium]